MARKKTPDDRRSQEEVAAELTKPLTVSYKEPASDRIGSDGEWDYAFFIDVDRMLTHPFVKECIRIYEGGVSGAKFEVVEASSSAVGAWAQDAIESYWEQHLPRAMRAYRNGWQAGELVYEERGDQLHLSDIITFHRKDAKPLVRRDDRSYAGVEVGNLQDQEMSGMARLSPGGRWPGRAFWHVHQRECHRLYGESQLRSAHRPWQRLAERQGTEENLDNAVTRYGVPGPKVRYDDSVVNKRDPATGKLDRSAVRDQARQMVQECLSGMALLLSSASDEKGKYKWDFEWPTQPLNAAPIMEVCKHWEARVAYGIGTPLELIESVETGGWAGRSVTLETFLSDQTRVAREHVRTWFKQIGLPLARFHFGPETHFLVRVIPLLEGRVDNAKNPDESAKPIGNSPEQGRGISYTMPRLLSTRRIFTRPMFSPNGR